MNRKWRAIALSARYTKGMALFRLFAPRDRLP